ncbi:hypothetical protein ACIBH1_12835 [Nonomuraea sp. NPDC050663]|uniref:hypothetical protein n=1 Tax=Nonomuraea sp. NPDC050663 TaxID=3364370 RepID=UPI0037A2FE56
MASPLQYGDPPRLGPFVIQARLHSMPAGFVYLGQADDGRAVSIALLTRGAALDGAARDRFVTAVREASPRRGTVLTGPAVLESDLGEAPWAATPYQPGRPGAERYLEPVMVGGILLGEVHGPDYVPYWLTDRAPALPGAGRPPRPATETRRRVLLALAVLLALLLLGVVIAILLFRGLDDTEPVRRPLPPTVFEPTPPPTPESQQPQPEPSPTPSQSTPGGTSPGLPPGEEDPDGEI